MLHCNEYDDEDLHYSFTLYVGQPSVLFIQINRIFFFWVISTETRKRVEFGHDFNVRTHRRPLSSLILNFGLMGLTETFSHHY